MISSEVPALKLGGTSQLGMHLHILLLTSPVSDKHDGGNG